MTGEDDEDDETIGIGVSRYPCMPSLVALQQMRNRLHLAKLGKKLMKWTAMATGRELRKVSVELNQVYGNFHDDLREAFMMIARSRYFYPNFNNMVLEHVPKQADVTVSTSLKSTTGVRVVQFEILEDATDGYSCLGIDRGGEMINEAKIVWRELLKRMVMMLQLRTSFITIDAANRNATKKMNVLGKVIVPRLKLTITYILSELEEKEREEFFRMKKILQVKMKKKIFCEHGNSPTQCHVCKVSNRCAKCGKHLLIQEVQAVESEITQMASIELREKLDGMIGMSKIIKGRSSKMPNNENSLANGQQFVIKIKDQNSLSNLCEDCKKAAMKEKGIDEEFKETFAKKIDSSEEKLGVFETEIEITTKIVRTRNEDGTVTEKKKVITVKRELRHTNIDSSLSENNILGTEDPVYQGSRMNVLGKLVIPRTQLSIKYIILELEEIAREEFSKLKKIKEKKKQKKQKDKQGLSVLEIKVQPCPICNYTPMIITSIAEKIVIIGSKDNMNVAPTNSISKSFPVEDSQKLKLPIQTISHQKVINNVSTDVSNVLQNLFDKLLTVMNTTKTYKENNFFNMNSKEFSRACKETQLAIEEYFVNKSIIEDLNKNVEHRLGHLKAHLHDVIEVVTKIKEDLKRTISIDKFTTSCKELEEKIDYYMKDNSENSLICFKSQIDNVIKIAQQCNNQGIVSSVFEEFITSCRLVNEQINQYLRKYKLNQLRKTKLEAVDKKSSNLEILTEDLVPTEIVSSCLQRFISICKDFIGILEKSKPVKTLSLDEGDIKNLASQLDEAIHLSTEAKLNNLISENVEDFIETCEEIKQHVTCQSNEKNVDDQKSPLLRELKLNIQNMIDFILNSQTLGSLSKSVENLVNSCDSINGRVEMYEVLPSVDEKKNMNDLTCKESCICNSPSSETLYEQCLKLEEEEKENNVLPKELTCECSKNSFSENLGDVEKNLCIKCDNLQKEEEMDDENQSAHYNIDSDVGYFERKIRKIIKVTRSINPDGTIEEETETITIKTEKHDPNDYRDLDDEDDSNDFQNTDDKTVALVDISGQIYKGFLKVAKKTKSAEVAKAPPFIAPSVRQCISERSNTMRSENSLKTFLLSDSTESLNTILNNSSMKKTEQTKQ